MGGWDFGISDPCLESNLIRSPFDVFHQVAYLAAEEFTQPINVVCRCIVAFLVGYFGQSRTVDFGFFGDFIEGDSVAGFELVLCHELPKSETNHNVLLDYMH